MPIIFTTTAVSLQHSSATPIKENKADKKIRIDLFSLKKYIITIATKIGYKKCIVVVIPLGMKEYDQINPNEVAAKNMDKTDKITICFTSILILSLRNKSNGRMNSVENKKR